MQSVTDRIPLPPVSAEKRQLVCHFCIVGCGYHVYKWPINAEGGRRPEENALGLDFTVQLGAMQTSLSPQMVNTIEERDGQQYNIMIVPDQDCVVNQGLSSTRGGQLASVMYNGQGASANRLEHPHLHTGDGWVAVGWEQAIGLYARLTKRVLDREGPDQLFFNLFDHGGAGGGFEDTWGTGKLIFSGLSTKMVRIHNRPAYNSECHASRDMGIHELNNSYLDAELADVILCLGGNSYETQSNWFLVHWVPNIDGSSTAKKREHFESGETAEPGRIIIVDPRRTPTVAVAEEVAGAERVLHLQPHPGTDQALFNGLLTYAYDQGWHDAELIERHTRGFDEAMRANRLSLEACSRITGIDEADLRQAAEWAYAPKPSGHRPRALHAYEKGIIWGNNNYRTQAALVDLAVATHNVNRRGTGVVRMGGHQEGYIRPPYPGGRPAPYIDEEILAGNGRMLTVWACNAFQTTNDAERYRKEVIRRSEIVRRAMAQANPYDLDELADAIERAVTEEGGLFITTIDLYPTKIGQHGHLMLPGAHPGERDLTSMNGERRMRLSEQFMDPPGSAKADCLIAAHMASELRALYEAEGNAEMAERFAGFDWAAPEDAFEDGFRRANQEGSEASGHGDANNRLVTYDRLRAMGNNGVQLPVKEYRDGELIGTEMPYGSYEFDTDDGKVHFIPAPWEGFLEAAAEQKEKYPFWINNGRTNQIWQSAYHDRYIDFRRGRYPLAPLEIHPDDAAELGVDNGDIVEVRNDYGTVHALAYLEPDIPRGQTFMMFGYPFNVAGDITTPAVDENIVPYYKGAWGELCRIGRYEGLAQGVSFKRRRYR
ncbi:MAG: arsenate reductase (azurin) large subunit [Halorhodospira sp.]